MNPLPSQAAPHELAGRLRDWPGDGQALRERAAAALEGQAVRIAALEAALDSSTIQMRVWISLNGDIYGALQEQVDRNDAALAKATPNDEQEQPR